MEYGRTEETEVIDTNGSRTVTETNFFKGVPGLPRKVTYYHQVKVRNKLQEQEEYAKFSEDVAADPKKLEPGFELKHSTLGDKNGYYYVVLKYTKLHY